MESCYTVFVRQTAEGFITRVPDVPGCVTGGSTLAEAVAMTRDALCGCLCAYQAEGIELPPRHAHGQSAPEPGEFAIDVHVTWQC